MTELERVFDGLAGRYDELYSDPASRNEDLDFDRRLARLIEANAYAVLDVGCGTGWFLDHYAYAVGRRYCGFDLSHGMVERLLQKHPDAEAWQWDMTHLPWIGGGSRFSLVVSLWCSPSYVDSWEFFEQAHRVLEPGGVVVAMPHAPGAQLEGRVTEWHDYLPLEVYTEAAGWRPWRAYDAERAAKEAGFVDVRVEGFRSGVPHLPRHAPDWVHRLARRLQPQPDYPDEATFLVVTGRKN